MLDTIERAIFDRLLSRVASVSPSASMDYLNALSFEVNVYIAHFHQIIGIVLRSTNARNSFEVYDPVLRLAKALLGDDTVLILSSEWDFVPFIMPSVGVPNCTVVGLPVMEAANALLTPLAGHELGHAVWRSRELGDLTEQDRKNALCDVFLDDWDTFKKHARVQDEKLIRARLEAKEWDLLPLDVVENPLEVMGKVCEELFCDMLGVRLFGTGYLYAFEYFAAPSLGGTELREYPALDARARYLADAISEVAVGDGGTTIGDGGKPPWPRMDGYASRFSEDMPRLDPEDQFLLESAHRACERLVHSLRKIATQVCESRADGRGVIPSPSFRKAREALDRFRRGLPAEGNLADLVNAGWLGYLDSDFWKEKPTWMKKKFKFLNEFVFKSLDVTEFEERRRENAPEVR